MSKEQFTQGSWWLIVFSLCHCSVSSYYVEDISQEVQKHYLGELSWETRLLDRYLEIESVSIMECANECLRRRRCKSFSYSPVMKFCELCYVELANGRRDDSFTATAFLHSDVKSWNEGLAGNCAKHKCDINSTCNLVNGSCEVSDCGREQEIANVKLLHYGHHEIGNGVIYGCKENHIMKDVNGDVIPSGQAVVFCNREGKWEDHNFGCYVQETCSSPWIPHDGHCYFFAQEKVNWTDAREKCLEKKSHLVSIDRKEEYDWIIEIPAATGTSQMWIGGNDQETEGTWVWEKYSSVIPETLLIQLWGPGEPNNTGGKENCMEIVVVHGVGRVNDITCGHYKKYICKR